MTRAAAFAARLISLLLPVATPVAAADINLNFYPISVRTLDDEPWDRQRDQTATMCSTVDFGGATWPIHIALGLHQSSDEHNDLDAIIGEMSFGIARVWSYRAHRIRPFIGAGASLVMANLEKASSGPGLQEDDDTGLGWYAEGGVSWRLGPHFNLGFYARVLTGTDLDLFGGDASADYLQYGPLLGWSWPARRPEPIPGVQ